MKILGVSGSLRKGSSNTALLCVTQRLAAPSVQVVLFESLGDLPHFNPDLDRESPPATVVVFRQQVADCEALLISTPEYAHGIPGVLKNALDWLVSDARFEGKPVGVIFGSATAGSFAEQALMEVLKTMSARVIEGAVANVQGVRAKLDPLGNLVDAQVSRDLLRVLMALQEGGKNG